jgi:hypothetical protein
LAKAWLKGFEFKKPFEVISFLHDNLVGLLEIEDTHIWLVFFEEERITGNSKLRDAAGQDAGLSSKLGSRCLRCGFYLARKGIGRMPYAKCV